MDWLHEQVKVAPGIPGTGGADMRASYQCTMTVAFPSGKKVCVCVCVHNVCVCVYHVHTHTQTHTHTHKHTHTYLHTHTHHEGKSPQDSGFTLF
jgi:hypothetical protein